MSTVCISEENTVKKKKKKKGGGEFSCMRHNSGLCSCPAEYQTTKSQGKSKFEYIGINKWRYQDILYPLCYFNK